MPRTTPQQNSKSRRAARALAAKRARRRRQLRPYFLAGVVLLVVGVIIAGVSISSSKGGLPSGTMIFSEPNHQHVTGTVHYDRTPPAGGPHDPVWLNCGVYTSRVRNENAVHDLEHGAVWITYRPNLSAEAVSELQRFVETHYDGTQRYLLLSPYPGLPAPVVASAWGAQIRLSGPNDPRLATFVAHFDGGSQGGETGAPCTGGTGTPLA